MNHLKIYESIIQKAKSESRVKLRKNQEGYVYYENHHIIPKCLGGLDDKENLVLLMAREHFICHMILIHIYPKERGLRLSLRRFQHSKNFNLYKISSRTYERIKILINELPISEKTKHLMSIGKKGKPHPHIGNHGKRNINRKGEFNTFYGKKHTLEAKEKMKIAKKGKPTSRKGMTLSEEHKDHLRKPHKKFSEETKNKLKGRKMSEETKKKISNKMKIIKANESKIN